MDEAQMNQLVKLISGKLSNKLQEQQQEQMNKMQEELDKMKEMLNKKSEDMASGVGKENEGEGGGDKTPKGFARISYDYGQGSKGPNGQLPIVNLGKPPPFDGVRYNDWAHRMKLHLIAARCWEVVDIGVRMPEEGSDMTPDDYIDIQLNATAATLILQCLTPEDNNKVHGLENAKQIWDTLRVSFEGDISVRKGNIELLQSKIENFGWNEGETT
jgi:ribosomal protein L9